MDLDRSARSRENHQQFKILMNIFGELQTEILGPCMKGSLFLGKMPVLTNSRDWKCKHVGSSTEIVAFQVYEIFKTLALR